MVVKVEAVEGVTVVVVEAEVGDGGEDGDGGDVRICTGKLERKWIVQEQLKDVSAKAEIQLGLDTI